MEAIKISKNVEFDVIYADGTRHHVDEGILFEAKDEIMTIHSGTNRKAVIFTVASALVKFIDSFGLIDEFKRYLQENKEEDT